MTRERVTRPAPARLVSARSVKPQRQVRRPERRGHFARVMRYTPMTCKRGRVLHKVNRSAEESPHWRLVRTGR